MLIDVSHTWASSRCRTDGDGYGGGSLFLPGPASSSRCVAFRRRDYTGTDWLHVQVDSAPRSRTVHRVRHLRVFYLCVASHKRVTSGIFKGGGTLLMASDNCQEVAFSRGKNAYSSLCAFAINDDGADRGLPHPFRNIWMRHWEWRWQQKVVKTVQ